MPNSATATHTASTAPAPQVLRDGPVAVIGAGPIGVLCATMLSQRGVPVVLIDRLPDPDQTLSVRSYVISLTGMGEAVMDRCPGLVDRIKAVAVESKSLRLDSPRPDGAKPAVLDIRLPDSQPPFQFIMRTQVMSVLCEYAREQDAAPIQWSTGTTVDGITFASDGSATLSLSAKDGKKETLVTRLVVACDGKNSPTLKALRADTSGVVASARGFAERAWANPTSSKAIKSVVTKGVRPIMRSLLPKDHEWPDTAGFMFFGKAKDRARRFSLGTLPTTPAANGIAENHDLASVMVERDSVVLKIDDVEEAFKLFEENFPYLDVRALISEKSMRDFVEHGPGIPFGKVRRPASIGGSIGGPHGCGGIVLLGDAAHSFPPDLGLGLNSGIADVGVLMDVIDGMEAKATCGDIAREYVSKRDEEVEGLVYLHRYGAQWQFGQPLSFGGLMWALGLSGRLLLSKIAPPVFKPPMLLLALGEDEVKFGKAMRETKATTRRIWACVAALAFVVMRRACQKCDLE